VAAARAGAGARAQGHQRRAACVARPGAQPRAHHHSTEGRHLSARDAVGAGEERQPLPAAEAGDGSVVRAVVLALERSGAPAYARRVVVRAGNPAAGQCLAGRAVPPAGDFFPETLPQSTLDFTPERDRYGQVDIDALVAAFAHAGSRPSSVAQATALLPLGVGVCRPVQAARHGFDLVLGNPPWIKVEWNPERCCLTSIRALRSGVWRAKRNRRPNADAVFKAEARLARTRLPA
jgi:hypothetical protein